MTVRLMLTGLLVMLIAACGGGGGGGGGGAASTSQAPVITSQPAGVTIFEGGAATFHVGASGTPALSYQWMKNDEVIAGAIEASYTTPITALLDDGSKFSVTITNTAGSVTSNTAVLRVTPNPSIRAQPVDLSVEVGNVATFSVDVLGTSPFTYQWKKNGVNISGAASASYTTPATELSDSGSTYLVTVTNAVGSVTSNAATLTVNTVIVAPSITSHPLSTTVAARNTATFSVSASGTAPLSYQWKKNGNNIDGATSASYTTRATAWSDNGSTFTVTVSNTAGSALSNAATLTVQAPPNITDQPVNSSVMVDSAATFSVTASGTAPLTYQWKKNGVNIAGAASASYTTPATELSDSGSTYLVTVSNVVGSVSSNAATLTVSATAVPPTITGQPSSSTVSMGNTATFSVSASGTAPLSYQWTKNGSNIMGATSANYTTPATALADNGSTFSVAVINAAGSATSYNATLTVIPLTVACSGSNCGANSPNTYSGTGIGMWKYENTSSSPISINLSVAGVSAGKKVTLTLTNGEETAAASVPSLGSAVSSSLGPDSAARSHQLLPYKPMYMHQQEVAHQRILQMNRESAGRLKTSGQKSSPKVAAQVGLPLLTPQVGAVRSWRESAFSRISYPSTNKHVCSLPNGRNVVFWQTNNDTGLSDTILSRFTVAVCGTDKGFHKLMGLMGDAWGNHPFNDDLITDAAGKQDVNIVFLPAPNAGWAGYFWSLNNFLSTSPALKVSDPVPNEALVFFINTEGIANDVDFYISTLIHEAKHMIGFYQEAVVRSKDVETWYEETSAMMSEDIVGAAVTGSNKIAQYKIRDYMNSGGNISLNNWSTLAASHYGMGGALGAFLNRRYGTKLFEDSIKNCTSESAKKSSYDCVDELIKSYGGSGLSDELARMGASVFSNAPGTALPEGYGYPEVSTNGYTLSAINLLRTLVGPPPSISTYKSMSQTQITETVGDGVTRYQRNNVVVPAKTSLYVVIR